jgi:PIN domain nuclease of toxin-antitoxin system
VILLDTHVALWVDQEPERLGPGARSRIENESRTCFSGVLAMETTMKQMLGRWRVPGDLPQRLVAAGLEDLPLTSAHAAAMTEFPELARHDPFDRLYVAQAHSERATLMTSDRRLLGLGHDWILDARR